MANYLLLAVHQMLNQLSTTNVKLVHALLPSKGGRNGEVRLTVAQQRSHSHKLRKRQILLLLLEFSLLCLTLQDLLLDSEFNCSFQLSLQPTQ